MTSENIIFNIIDDRFGKSKHIFVSTVVSEIFLGKHKKSIFDIFTRIFNPLYFNAHDDHIMSN